MLGNIEHTEKNQPRAVLLVDVCRKQPDTFISFEDLRDEFGWSVVTTLTAVDDAQKHLNNGALYTISWEGIVYEPKGVAVGDSPVEIPSRPCLVIGVSQTSGFT